MRYRLDKVFNQVINTNRVLKLSFMKGMVSSWQQDILLSRPRGEWFPKLIIYIAQVQDQGYVFLYPSILVVYAPISTDHPHWHVVVEINTIAMEFGEENYYGLVFWQYMCSEEKMSTMHSKFQMEDKVAPPKRLKSKPFSSVLLSTIRDHWNLGSQNVDDLERFINEMHGFQWINSVHMVSAMVLKNVDGDCETLLFILPPFCQSSYAISGYRARVEAAAH